MEIDLLDLEEIPHVEILPPPPEDCIFDEFQTSSSNYSLYMNKGSRRFMLDRYYVNQAQDTQVYAVFDGHGFSAMASEFVSQTLHKNVQQQGQSNAALQSLAHIKQAFQKTEQELHNYTLGYPECGTTALYVEVTASHITVASLGDSQAIVVKKGGKHVVLSTLHTPSNPLERARVEQAGGWVLNVGNVPRIQGKLAVSRAFGNHTIRKFLTSDPDVVTYKRDPDDIALIIATDGLWNILDGPNIATLVDGAKIQTLSKLLYDTADAIAKHYVRDNVTVLSVGL